MNKIEEMEKFLIDCTIDEETFYEEIKEKSEFDEWREEDNCRRYREYQSDNRGFY